MKFLVIRTGDIGDIVLSTPVIRCIKKQLPLAEVHFLLNSRFRLLLEQNPYVDKVHSFTESETIGEELRSENFDIVIDLQDDRFSRRIIRELGVTAKSYDRLAFKKALYTRFKVNTMPSLHVVDRYLKTVESLQVKDDGEGLDYFIPSRDEVVEKDIPASHHLGYIALVIGGSKFNKKMPVEKLKEICLAIDHPIILLGANEDFNEGYQVSSIDPVKIYNACGKFNLNESADLLKKSRLVISHDTGLMHIAAAFKKPIISVWGSTVPSFGMVPYYGKRFQNRVSSEMIQVKNLWCRPCSERGLDHCPQGHFKCMKKISVPAVVEQVKALLKADQNSNSFTEG